ncbi:18451_t:CDS:2, partial [Acaulospora morrowiae]
MTNTIKELFSGEPFEYSEYFAKTRPHEWREKNFILWLEANGENLFAGSRPLQERKIKWHNQFLNSLESVISLCKSFLEDPARIMTTDDRSHVKSLINKASSLIKDLTVVGVRASRHLFRETFGQLVVSGRLGHVAEVVTEQTVVGVRISRHLFQETFGQLNKVPNDVSQWWIQWELENFKEREKLIMAQDSLSQVEWTSARNEETRKRFWEVDALDKNDSINDDFEYQIEQNQVKRTRLERQQTPENQTYPSSLPSKNQIINSALYIKNNDLFEKLARQEGQIKPQK